MLSIAFIAITFFSLILFYYGTGKDKRVLALRGLWSLIVGVVFGGYFTNTNANPPRFLIVLMGAFSLSAML